LATFGKADVEAGTFALVDFILDESELMPTPMSELRLRAAAAHPAAAVQRPPCNISKLRHCASALSAIVWKVEVVDFSSVILALAEVRTKTIRHSARQCLRLQPFCARRAASSEHCFARARAVRVPFSRFHTFAWAATIR
jgi:hypothetical protein